MVAAERGVGGDDDADGTINTREFLNGDDVLDVAHAGAAELGGEDGTHETEAAEFFDDGERELRGLIPLHDVRQDLALGEFANTLAELLLLVSEIEVHGCSCEFSAESQMTPRNAGRRRDRQRTINYGI